jgi:hypothetical protein
MTEQPDVRWPKTFKGWALFAAVAVALLYAGLVLEMGITYGWWTATPWDTADYP